MATKTNAIVTTRKTTISRPHEYLGNVKHIPVSVDVSSVETADVVEFTEVLPQNTKVIGVRIGHSAMGNAADKLSIGVTGALTGIANLADVENAGSITYSGLAVDAGGKQVLGTVTANTNWGASKALTGYILVVTDQ